MLNMTLAYQGFLLLFCTVYLVVKSLWLLYNSGLLVFTARCSVFCSSDCPLRSELKFQIMLQPKHTGTYVG